MATKITPKGVLEEPILKNNPIAVQILGICSALAVTVKLETAFVMSVSVIFVVSFSNLVISLLRKWIPSKIRIMVELAVISALVIIVDQVLKAYSYEISKQLSVFVGLIITNCILMGRAEAFAIQKPPGLSFLDGLGNGVGYAIILMFVAFARELLGSGALSLLGFSLPEGLYEGGYSNNGLMVLAPGAFFILSLIVLLVNAYNLRKEAKR